MSANNRRVNQDVFVVRILRKHFKDALPHAPFAPARVAQMHDAKVTKAPGQVLPGDARAVAVQHRFDKQPVISRRHAHMALAPGQQVLDAFPLIVSQCISSGRCLEIKRSAQRSRVNRLGK